jgi:ribonuclease R
MPMDEIPSYDDLVELGRHISFTERRSADAEKELKQVKIMELLARDIGEVYDGVITGVANFGVFVQIQPYLIDGLIRYDRLMDDWWDVDEKAGMVRGQRTGVRIRIGDTCKAAVARVDVPRRELDLQITELLGRPGEPPPAQPTGGKKKGKPDEGHGNRGGRNDGGNRQVGGDRNRGGGRSKGGGGGGGRDRDGNSSGGNNNGGGRSGNNQPRGGGSRNQRPVSGGGGGNGGKPSGGGGRRDGGGGGGGRGRRR